MTPAAAPLILTLAIERTAFQRLDALRREHFPAHLNQIPAHLTLFHHLPGQDAAQVRQAAVEAAARQEPFDVAVTGLRKLGRGVALNLHSDPLAAVRARIAARFIDHLTPQDKQGFRPHVTVQNKVDPRQAAALYDELSATFTPWRFRAEGLLLWRYLGGPWQRLAFAPFAAPPPDARGAG